MSAKTNAEKAKEMVHDTKKEYAFREAWAEDFPDGEEKMYEKFFLWLEDGHGDEIEDPHELVLKWQLS